MPDPSGHTQDQSSLTYLRKLGTNLLDSVVRRFSNPETARRNRFLLLIVTSLVLTLILLPSQHLTTALYQPGEIATSDIRATQDYLLEDKVLTRQLRAEAELTTPVVYTFSDRVANELVGAIFRALQVVREHSNRQLGLRDALIPILDAQLSDAELRALSRVRNEKALLADLDRQFPGMRFRMIDEQDRIREHIRFFINQELAGNLGLALRDADELQIICAISGG